MKSHFLESLAVGVFTLGLAFGAQAQYLNITGNASASDTAHYVSEPVTAAQTISGTTWYTVAYMRDTNNLFTSAKVYTVSSGNLRSQVWTNQQPAPIDAKYDKSGDPVLVTGGGRMYLLTTTWNQTDCTGDNQITLFTSTDGGNSWPAQTAIAANTAGQNVFDDKPAALVSQYAPRAGTVFIAFSRASCSSGINTLALYSYSSSGTLTQLNPQVSGAITNPVIYEDPTYGTLWLSYMDFHAPSAIRFRVSYDGGNSWSDPGGDISDPNLLIGGSVVCDTQGSRCAGAALGMTGKFNPVSGVLTLAWAHRVDLSGGGANSSQAQVVYTWGLPGRWFPADLVTPNVAGHATWTPALDIGSNGNVLVTYYDDPQPALPLQYLWHATEITPNGARVGDQPDVRPTAIKSDESGRHLRRIPGRLLRKRRFQRRDAVQEERRLRYLLSAGRAVAL